VKRLLNALFGSGLVWLAGHYRRLSLDLVKIRAAIWYLKGVQAARRAFIGVVALGLCLGLVLAGFVLVHVGLFLLLPHPANAIVLLALGAIYLVGALLALRWACSEKTWLKFSNASRYTALATKKPEASS